PEWPVAAKRAILAELISLFFPVGARNICGRMESGIAHRAHPVRRAEGAHHTAVVEHAIRGEKRTHGKVQFVARLLEARSRHGEYFTHIFAGGFHHARVLEM